MKLLLRFPRILILLCLLPIALLATLLLTPEHTPAQEVPIPSTATDTTARFEEAVRLYQQGLQYFQVNQIQAAIQSWQQALEIFRGPDVQAAFPEDSRRGESAVLGNLGMAYGNLGQYQEAIAFSEQSLVILREVGDRQGEGSILNNLGLIYSNLGQYQQAIAIYEQRLALARETGDRQYVPLSNLGNAYQRLGQYQRAIEFYEQSLAMAREASDRAEEGDILGLLGSVYRELGQYPQALEQLEQSLAIAREVGNRRAEGNVLGGLGNVYFDLGQYPQAIARYEQQLTIARQVANRLGESDALASLGNTYSNVGQYRRALDLFDQSLTITREMGDLRSEGNTLSNIGLAYMRLGQYPEAIARYEQSLAISREIDNRRGEGGVLGNLGIAYAYLGQYQEAIARYEQQLTIAREIGDRQGEGIALGNSGSAYRRLGRNEEGIERHEQSLAIAREIGDREGEGSNLGNLGNAYRDLGQYQDAFDYYQQALALTQSIGNRSSEGLWLSNIGSLLAEQDQSELAIVFYKQSVNIREAIRNDLRGLPQAQQDAFTETIADDYRALAALLLEQNRVLEAQRVLDLLRVQELDDYLRGVRGTAQTESGIELRDPELELSNRVIAIGYELAQLREVPPNQLSEEQLQRLTELDALQRELAEDFQGFISSPEIQALVAQLDADLQEQDVLARMDEFVNLQNNLRAIDQNAVLIYPLILDDRLELVLVTPFSEPARYSVAVEQAELNAAIVAFRQALDDPNSNPEPIAQQLYEWLVAPMANDLEAIGAETLLYAPDGALRYVPLAALHDGDQWLIERFRINHITAASLQDFTLRPDPQPQILAAAFSEGAFEVQIGQRSVSYNGLPFAGIEVENLTAAFPGTTQLMNENFSRTRVEPIMDSHTIVHFATHAAFVPGSPADSFILFGNGDRLTLQEIREEWNGRFNRVDLIVLSACETGLGDDILGSGEEILGFGYLMQQAGAAAAIASLWQVNDGGTQVLMDAFYAALNNGYSKADALQRAQIALITSDQTVLAGERGTEADYDFIDLRTGQPLSQSSGLAHPHYWAPFILIGNGL